MPRRRTFARAHSLPAAGLLLLFLGGCGEAEPAPAPKRPDPAEARVPDWAPTSATQAAEAKRLGVPVRFEEPTTGMRFVLAPGGTFRMGSPDDETGRDEDEGPSREVTVAPFYVATFE